MLGNFDVRATAGAANRAVTRTFSGIQVSSSALEISLLNLTNAGSILSAIEITADEAVADPTPTVTVQYSSNNGAAWSTLAINVPVDTLGRGQFSWTPTVPTNTRTSLIRVVSEQGIFSSAQSPNAFEVVNSGVDYYISPTGNDVNGGKTPDRPMRTLNAVLESFNLDAGDRIHVASGAYPLVRDVVIDSQDSGVLIQGPADASAIFNRQIGSTSNIGYGIVLNNADSVTIDSISITGAYSGVYASQTSDSDDLTVRNSRLFGNYSTGLEIGGTNDRLVFRNNDVFGLPGGDFIDNQIYGVALELGIIVGGFGGGADHLIEENDIFDNGTGLAMRGARAIARNNQIHGNNTGIQASALVVDADRHRIVGNEIFANLDGINAFGPVTVQGNRIYGHTATNRAGITVSSNSFTPQVIDNDVYNNFIGVNVTGGPDTLVQDNDIYANSSVGLIVVAAARVIENRVYSNSVGIRGAASYAGTMSSNLVYANTNTGIQLENTSNAIAYVTNNTIYQQVGDAIRVRNSARNITLANNIVWILSGYAINVDSNSQTGFVSNYNLLHKGADANARIGFWNGDHSTLADWQTATSRDTNSLSADPLLVDIDGADNILGYVSAGNINGGADDNFYRLQNSPATDRGDDWAARTSDFDGFAAFDDLGVVNAGRPTLKPTILGNNQFTTTGTAQNWRSNNTQFAYTFTGGFTFPFFGTTYTAVSVSTEGLLQFGTFNSIDGNNSALALVSAPRIAALWDNIRTSGAGDDIFVDTSVAGQVKFRWNATNEADNSDVQLAIVLFANGEVRFDYGPGNTGLTPTVAITNGNGYQIELVGGYDAAASLTNANSVSWTLAPSTRDMGAYEYRGNSNDTTGPRIISSSPAVVHTSGLTATAISQIGLVLDEDLFGLSTLSTSQYELRGAGVNNQFGDGDDVLYALTPEYLPLTDTLNLRIVSGALPAGQFRLTVFGTSMIDLSGNRLDGDANGTAGGNYVRTFRTSSNTAPILTGNYHFGTIDEDIASAANTGTLVSTLLAGRITDSGGPGVGLAVTGVDDSLGQWQYSLNGTSFSAIAPQVTSGQTLLLAADATTRIRFQPTANSFGTGIGIQYRAWDRADETPAGSSVPLSSLQLNSLSNTAATSTISVISINDAPSDIALSANTIREKLPAGTLVGQLSATDIDSPSPVTYTLVDGVGSADNSRFTIVGNELRLAEELDFETQPTRTIRLRTSDDVGDVYDEVFTISVTNAPIRVTGIYVRGSGWNSSYLAMLEANGLGTAVGGVRLVDGPNQLANSSTLTWQTINQVTVTFDEGAVIDANALRLINGSNQDLALSSSGYSYDDLTRTARWTLASPLNAGRFLISLEAAMITDAGSARLDGEWTTSADTFGSAGDELAGGDLNFLFHYLPGDVSRNGQTNPGDVNLLRSLGTITPDATNYWRDVTGNNQINPGDVNYVRSLGTIALPAATPTIPPPPRGGSPLMASTGFAVDRISLQLAITSEQLANVVTQAIDLWAGSGLNDQAIARLKSVPIIVGDLGNGPYLGMSFADHVVIDDDAAGWGWAVDEPVFDRFDLLTVVMHELGHQLGLEDVHQLGAEDELMFWQLAPGERKSILRAELVDEVWGS